jgi:hypothetical protein
MTDLVSDVVVFYDEDGTWLEPIEQYAPRKWYQCKPTVVSVNLRRASQEKTHQGPLDMFSDT